MVGEVAVSRETAWSCLASVMSTPLICKSAAGQWLCRALQVGQLAGPVPPTHREDAVADLQSAGPVGSAPLSDAGDEDALRGEVQGGEPNSRAAGGYHRLPLPAYPIASSVGRGAFPSSNAEAQALLAAHQAGHMALSEGPGGLGQGQAQATKPPFPRAVVILRPQRRDSDRVLGLHHALPPQSHVHGAARPPQCLHSLVVLSVLQGHPVHLQTAARVRAGTATKPPHTARQGWESREQDTGLLGALPVGPAPACNPRARSSGTPQTGSTPESPVLETLCPLPIS